MKYKRLQINTYKIAKSYGNIKKTNKKIHDVYAPLTYLKMCDIIIKNMAI